MTSFLSRERENAKGERVSQCDLGPLKKLCDEMENTGFGGTGT